MLDTISNKLLQNKLRSYHKNNLLLEEEIYLYYCVAFLL